MNEPICAGCSSPPSQDETHVCDNCASSYEITDPNYAMTGGEDG